MKYAVIETGGKQYKVSVGDTFPVENLNVESGNIDFDRVLLTVDGDSIQIGEPYVNGAVVAAKIVSAVKGPKIRVSQYKSKVRHRRTIGHRQSMTQIEITEIGGKTAVKETKAKKSAPAKN